MITAHVVCLHLDGCVTIEATPRGQSLSANQTTHNAFHVHNARCRKTADVVVMATLRAASQHIASPPPLPAVMIGDYRRQKASTEN